VRAPAYRVKPALTTAYYTYWSGVDVRGGEMHSRDCVKRMVGAWPTNDGLVMTYVAAPISEFPAYAPTQRGRSWPRWTGAATSRWDASDARHAAPTSCRGDRRSKGCAPVGDVSRVAVRAIHGGEHQSVAGRAPPLCADTLGLHVPARGR
jgi:hypothetical protein